MPRNALRFIGIWMVCGMVACTLPLWLPGSLSWVIAHRGRVAVYMLITFPVAVSLYYLHQISRE
jgi:hypothetical protein